VYLSDNSERNHVGNRHNRPAAAIAATLAAVTVVLSGAMPASAQDNRQKTKNDWRNLAIAAGGLTAFGLLKHDSTLSLLGGAGALYSLNRYEQDRKSQSKASQARAAIFSHQYIYRDGKRYRRQVVSRNGHKYYRFVRG
jgi:hypothetical protein